MARGAAGIFGGAKRYCMYCAMHAHSNTELSRSFLVDIIMQTSQAGANRECWQVAFIELYRPLYLLIYLYMVALYSAQTMTFPSV